MKFLFDDEELIFALVEENEFFRLSVERSTIEPQHVEEFMDKTVEWLSTNPQKGILIDFKGVSEICADFTIILNKYYEDIKRKGLHVRFVNVDPRIEPFIYVSNITVVMTVVPEKTVLSAKQLLEDFSNNLSDKDLIQKYGLSQKGLASMFRKLLRKGLITRRALAKRLGIESRDITVCLNRISNHKVTVDAADVLRDLECNLTDQQLMHKYRLSARGIQSLMKKLLDKGLISRGAILKRKKKLSPKIKVVGAPSTESNKS
jgi:anti-anti-sigma regulatory factor